MCRLLLILIKLYITLLDTNKIVARPNLLYTETERGFKMSRKVRELQLAMEALLQEPLTRDKLMSIAKEQAFEDNDKCGISMALRFPCILFRWPYERLAMIMYKLEWADISELFHIFGLGYLSEDTYKKMNEIYMVAYDHHVKLRQDCQLYQDTTELTLNTITSP